MNYQKQKEASGVLDQLLSNTLYYTSPVYTYDDDGFRKAILELYGVQYIGQNGNGYEYEAVIFNEYKCSTSEVIFISNALTEMYHMKKLQLNKFLILVYTLFCRSITIHLYMNFQLMIYGFRIR